MTEPLTRDDDPDGAAKATAGAPGLHALVLSPHLDDAALSCGGQIAKRCRHGETVKVFTVFAGRPSGRLTPLANELHTTWNVAAEADDFLEQRRQEDRRALEILGAELEHAELTDAAYRRIASVQGGDGPPAYPTLRSLFAAPANEPRLWAALIDTLRSLPAAEHVLIPLAVGGHVDHQLVRSAAEEVFGDHPRLRYYEDYPYARRHFALRRALRKRAEWEPLTETLEPPDLDAKVKAVACYDSQLGPVFKDRRDLDRKLRAFARSRKGERLWRRR